MKVIHFEISLRGLQVGKFHLLKYDSNSEFTTSGITTGFSNEAIDLTITDKTVEKQNTNNSIYKHDTVKLAMKDATHGDTNILKDDKTDRDYNVLLSDKEITGCCNCLELLETFVFKVKTSELFVMLFYTSLYHSQMYRSYVFKNLLNLRKCSKIRCNEKNIYSVVYISIPSYGDHNVIDYKWNDILQNLCLQKKEVDNAMSWLSTLGGACSALGDENKHFANMAGHISIKQFSLAVKLGDDFTVARCKLYYALSLIQKGLLKSANRIIKEQYHFATNNKVRDNKLISMCLGIHAKLRYEYIKRKYKS